AGYPGSYGDGRLAVWSEEKTRKSIWEALLARRTYAVTGDKIECQFDVNGAPMGSEIQGGSDRDIHLQLKGCNAIDKIILYKNLRPWKVINGEELAEKPDSSKRFKVRIEMGWGNKEEGYHWKGRAS